MVNHSGSRLEKILQNLEKKGMRYPKEKKSKTTKKSSQKGKSKTKGKKSQKGVVVKGMSVDTPEARIGDRVRSTVNFTDYGEILGVDEETGGWLTNTGKILNPRKQDVNWEVMCYNIYVLTLRPKPKKKPNYLPNGWPFNTHSSNLNSVTETNLDNINLLDEETNNNNSSERNDNGEYYQTEMACITAMSPERAREILVEEGLNGLEDMDENYEYFENSVWFDDRLTSVKFVGYSHFQKEMLLCIG